jgi:hypothetical protein
MTDKNKTIQVTLPTNILRKLEEQASRRELDVSDFIRIALRSMSRKSKFFAMGDTLTFGKYEDEVLDTVIQTDPTYIVWCIRNIEGFLVSEEAEDLLIEVLQREDIDIGPDLYKLKKDAES